MRNRRGFTLIEIMISITVLLVMMGAAVQFMRRQTNAVAVETGRMDALQNVEFASTQMERELREAGAGVTDVQPMIVQMDKFVITFNANMTSIDSGDVRAVYQTLDADPNAVRSMDSTERRALPLSDSLYPQRNYYAAKGFASGAETISYYFVRDSTTGDSTYVLYRRVNALTPTVVARNIVTKDTIPFLTYFKQDKFGRLIPVATNLLPLYHTITHGAASDTGKRAITDSIRVVRMHFVARSIDPRAKKDSIKYRTIETRVRLENSGLLALTACGQPPLNPGVPTLTQTAPGVIPQTVTVSWTRSGDDGTGERDIERYAIFRRLSSDTRLGDPISSIPGTMAGTYSFVDTSVLPNATYVYGVAGQDCTPNVSDVMLSAPITVNP